MVADQINSNSIFLVCTFCLGDQATSPNAVLFICVHSPTTARRDQPAKCHGTAISRTGAVRRARVAIKTPDGKLASLDLDAVTRWSLER